jgi:prepilin-type N-terminal cleavage/methylation domain-containing protein
LQKARQQGFTLIELSIVLVVIGLIVGGVLVGQNLIAAAGLRATISQIEKYNTAVNTFRTKYNNQLPGDIDATDAAQFGFAGRGQFAGEGDGNGVIEGVPFNSAGSNSGFRDSVGEIPMFWVDLSTASLIGDSFTIASSTLEPGSNITTTTSPAVGAYFPAAKLGGGNYINIWSKNGVNYYGLSMITGLAVDGVVASDSGLSVMQASSIDAKIDDGLPQSGHVTAQYLDTFSIQWAASGVTAGANPGSAAPASLSSCYDNQNNASNPMTYSLSQNGGANLNCALSFQFQ